MPEKSTAQILLPRRRQASSCFLALPWVPHVTERAAGLGLRKRVGVNESPIHRLRNAALSS